MIISQQLLKKDKKKKNLFINKVMPVNISYGGHFKGLFNDKKYILAYFIF